MLVVVFVATHFYLIWLSIQAQPTGSVDIGLYEWWVKQGWADLSWPGLDRAWVYPVLALAPMVAPVGLEALSGGLLTYLVAWCLMVSLLNAVVSLVMISVVGLRRAAWPLAWWFVFLALLGPVSITRLDGIIMPLVLTALVVAAARPGLAALLLTVGAWIKVVPGVLMAPLAFVTGRAWRKVVAVGGGVSLLVVLWVWLVGGHLRWLLSFLSTDQGRGLQVEAVMATPVVLAHAAGGDVIWEYNHELFTVETWGQGAQVVASVGNVLLPLACLAVICLAWLARRRPADALLFAAQALMAVMIVFNKVGSPQFYTWLAPAVVVGLASGRHRGLWWPMAGLSSVAAVLTWLIYPTFYITFLEANPWMLVVLTLRNVCMVVIMCGALVGLWRLVRAVRVQRAEALLLAD